MIWFDKERFIEKSKNMTGKIPLLLQILASAPNCMNGDKSNFCNTRLMSTLGVMSSMWDGTRYTSDHLAQILIHTYHYTLLNIAIFSIMKIMWLLRIYQSIQIHKDLILKCICICIFTFTLISNVGFNSDIWKCKMYQEIMCIISNLKLVLTSIMLSPV